MAWELLTKVFQLDEKRLYATYFKGDTYELGDDIPEGKVVGVDIKPGWFKEFYLLFAGAISLITSKK